MSEPASVLIRHPIYYYPNGTHVIRVQNMLYKVHDDILAAHSGVLGDMFKIGHLPNDLAPTPGDGRTDTTAIVLHDEHTIFDLFLDHVNGRSRSVGSDNPYSHEQLKALLAFVDKYDCEVTRQFAIDHVWDSRYTFHPSELVRLGLSHNVAKFFKRGFKSLLDIPIKQITKDHRDRMTDRVFIALVYAKAVLDEHNRIIASEEPAILTHAHDCQDPTGCQEDWHAAWWNGMGRFLLDGRNPQPFADAIKRFREMEFGRMGAGCRRTMLQILGRGAGFRYADTFVADICSGLIAEYRLTASLDL